MKRRTPKPKREPVSKPVKKDLEQPDHNATAAQVAVHAETEGAPSPAHIPLDPDAETDSPAILTNPPVDASADADGSDISDELLQEIENFTNSFHLQRHPGIRPPSAADRRTHPRYAFNATAQVAAADSRAKIKTIVRDLSQQGCYLDTDDPLPLGTSVNVRITKGAISIEVQGRVVYNRPGKGMGLVFTAVLPEHGGTLDSWINESRETSWLANNRRRSQRVLMKVPVHVAVQIGVAALSEEETYTLAVSAHGALIVVSAPMYRGQRLTLTNPHTRDSLECVVAHIDKFPDEQVKVGVEFLLPNPTFWHVAFPPKDWSPRHPDAKSRLKT